MAKKSKAGPVCEYGTVNAFLNAVSERAQATILLAPVHRPIGNAVQAGALLTSQIPDDYPCVHLCVILAVEAVLVGERGRVTYPYRQAQPDRQVRQKIRDLQQELLTVLLHTLQHDPRGAHVRSDAFYQVPEIQTWNRQALAGFPVTYQDGHWIASADRPEMPF
ncbi:hypothetical protein KSF_107330 [Reticulibacter mediterranei]|uniref:Uncharacterized protein n=1 Tax=Reticulibacter mediterranei TaxID=2778369 RepID=A0A8J3IY90_9CHLR|nr:hypothetical protein [Reticulibacter mediterranei]GHP00686.1 hypothetical protein KSF_107330 [Reticulibacter mediterranei]